MFKKGMEKFTQKLVDAVTALCTDNALRLSGYIIDQKCARKRLETSGYPTELLKAADDLFECARRIADELEVDMKVIERVERLTLDYCEAIKSYMDMSELIDDDLESFSAMEMFHAAGEDGKDQVKPDFVYNEFVKALNETASRMPQAVPFAMGHMIGCLPVRMTSEKFYEHVTGVMASMPPDVDTAGLASLIKLLKSLYAPMKSNTYGKLLPDEARLIEEMMNANWGELDEDDFSAHIDKIEKFAIRMAEYAEATAQLWELAQSIRTAAEYGTGNMFADKVAKDAFFAAIELNTREDNPIATAAAERLEGLLDKNSDNLGSLIDYIVRESGRVKDPDERTRALLEGFRVLGSRRLMEMPQILGRPTPQEAKKPRDEQINDFIMFIKLAHNGISPKHRRILRRHFMRELPCMLSTDEFLTYVRKELDELEDWQLYNVLMRLYDDEDNTEDANFR